MFVAIERRVGESALVPRDVFANREFALSCLVILMMSAMFFASLLYLPQSMQKTLDMRPIKAGAGLLPMIAVFACVSFVAGPLYDRLGPKLLTRSARSCLTVGPVLLSLILADTAPRLALVPGMVVLGLGVGLFYSSATTAGVTAWTSALEPRRRRSSTCSRSPAARWGSG